MDSPPSGSLGGAGARPHGGWGSFRLRKAVEKNAGLGHSWVWAPELAEVQRPGWCGLESPWALLFGEAPDERWSLTHHQTDPLVLEGAVGEGVGAGSLPSRAPRPLGQAWQAWAQWGPGPCQGDGETLLPFHVHMAPQPSKPCGKSGAEASTPWQVARGQVREAHWASASGPGGA